MLSENGFESCNFTTDRLKFWKAKELTKSGAKTISDIETFGCTVIHVAADKRGQGWSYTVGVFDTCGCPDLLVVGLKVDTA